MGNLLNFLQNNENVFSSKRLFGLGCFLVGTIYIFTIEPVDPTILGICYGSASAVFGVQALTKT